MLFPSQTSRAFTKADIETFPIGKNGCYGIFKKDVWIYIGKGDIRERMLAHINGDIPCILNQGATHWVYEITANMDQREKELIAAGNPACNKRIG
jgi:hypothetical protein